MMERIHAAEKVLECPSLAISGSSNHLRATSAYPPAGDIRWPMSVIVLISSGSPPEADVAAVGRDSPELTQPGHWHCGLKWRIGSSAEGTDGGEKATGEVCLDGEKNATLESTLI